MSEASEAPPVREGDVLAGKYRVERVLGAGAMGVVVSAMHVHLGERVALKFLHADMLENGEVVARFLREAQSAVRIKGEHVCRVSDVGTLESGAPYMVMEYLVGSDLSAVIESRGPLDVPLVADIVIQACDALAEAHALGIVHRDLKPSNLFLTQRPDGSPLIKVLDFGIAKLLADDPSKPKLTANGAVLGSPLYMAPEQILGSKGLDARADVWALGVILFELLSGKPPFDGNSFTDIIIAIGTQPPPSLRGLRPDVSEELEAIVVHCLEKDPQKRMPDVAALATALLSFVTSRRSHVVVENIVTMLHGAEAAEKLPPMRPTLTSGQSFGSTPAAAFVGSSGRQPAAAPSSPGSAGTAPTGGRPAKRGATLLMTGSAPPVAVAPGVGAAGAAGTSRGSAPQIAAAAPAGAGRAPAPLSAAASAQATMPGMRTAAGNDVAVDSIARPPMVKGPPWLLIGLITAIVGAAVTFGLLRALAGDATTPSPALESTPSSGRPL